MAPINIYTLCAIEKVGHNLIRKDGPPRPALNNTSVLQKHGLITKLGSGFCLRHKLAL